MNYIRLYIKRTFTHNIKKQMFLIIGIAAFVAMLVSAVMRADANEWELVNDSRSENYGFSAKICKCPLEGITFLEEHEEIALVQPVELVEVLSGPVGVELVVSSHVPDTWELNYLYGEPPGPGEIVLTDTVAIGKRQPELGETIRITVKVGEEEKQVDAVVSGVVKGVCLFTDEYAFLNEEDFNTLTGDLRGEERCYDVFIQNIYRDFISHGDALRQMFDKYGTISSVAYPEVFNREYDWEWVLSWAIRVTVYLGVCLMAVIYLILQDDRKIIGVYRTLGANKFQITAMVTARILCSGGIGTVIGFLFVLLVESVENLLTITNTAAIDGIGWSCLLYVSLGIVAALVLLQLPALHHLLRETPITLLEETVSTGENLVRLKKPKVLKVKHPLWWYSGLEGKRLKGRQVGMILITVFAFRLMSELVMAQDVYMQDGRVDAKETTYTVRKEGVSFSKEELEILYELQGLKVETVAEEPEEPLREVAVVLLDAYEKVAKSVEEAVPGARLVEDKQYIGNLRDELNHDTRIALLADIFVPLLSAVVFLFCYFAFYYMEKVEELRKLYALGASIPMIRKVMFLQSLRSSFVIIPVNVIVSLGVYYYQVELYGGQWLEDGFKLYPVVEVLILILVVFGVTMGATWFASRQVLHELEQKA